MIDDQPRDLDLWRGNQKFARFGSDPAEKLSFRFTSGGYSYEMVWLVNKRFEAGGNLLPLGGITKLVRKSRDLAGIR